MEERRAEGSLHLVLRDIELRRKHVAQAVARSNNSAPGPDGIPYAAWRRMGNVGIDILFAAACEIASEDGSHLLAQHYGDFNASLLMFLPQKTVDVLENGQEVFEVSGVRPLNITNTSNRLIASAARVAIEPCLVEMVTMEQRGFIGGVQ